MILKPKKHNYINIILQARSNSERLPFKSLMPINNIPLVVLCANRLMGKGAKVTVITSDKKSDDFLVNNLKKHKINFFRGNLDNVYKRFLDFSKKLKNDDIMIRTTADNPFVNYKFLKKVLEYFVQHNSIYKRVDHSKHNLPYGMSVEIFRKKLLLEYKNDVSKISKEHVTTKFKKYDDQKIILPNKLKTDYSNLSCTIDTFDDYKKINKVFNKFKHPYKTSWERLILELKKFKVQNKKNLKKTKYIIGGAQIGNRYNNFKKFNIKNLVKKNVIKYFNSIDTAFGYKDSHKEIAKINLQKYKFNIITKLNFTQKETTQTNNIGKFYLNFYSILSSLNENKVDTLLIHNFNDFKKYGSTIIEILNKLKRLNLINNYGVSIYNPKSLQFLMKNYKNLTIQFPINFIDYRWNKLDIKKLKLKSKSILMGRSIFLRGSLLSENNFSRNTIINNLFNQKVSKIKMHYKIKSNLELCIRFVNSLVYLDNIVFGFEKYNHILQTLKYKNKKFSSKDTSYICNQFKFLKTKYIDLSK
tara:strand:+ start:7168 stop:8754 length:1587 start_codon:yes stop_codon:yes gene_type:complete